MEIKDGWVVLIALLALFFGALGGLAAGESAKCRDAWLASHNAADSTVVARVCKEQR